jgi:hypothetical protein
MTKGEILESFKGQICAACGGKKGPRMSHCTPCYHSLPPEQRQALYRRFGDGYEEAFLASLEYLRGLTEETTRRCTGCLVKMDADDTGEQCRACRKKPAEGEQC